MKPRCRDTAGRLQPSERHVLRQDDLSSADDAKISGAIRQRDLVNDETDEGRVSDWCSSEVDAAHEAAELRDLALRLLVVGVGDHTPIEVRERVSEIARRLAQLEPPAHEWA